MISTENESPPRSGSTEPSLRQSREPGLTEAEMGREESYMRVEAYNQVQQLYQTKKVNKTRQTGSESRTHQLQFSSLGKDIRAAQAAVAGAPAIREEMTASIKAQIQNGTYKVDNASFADRLLQKRAEMDAAYEEMR